MHSIPKKMVYEWTISTRRFSTLLIIREMKIKPQQNITTQLELLKFNRLITPDISQDAKL